MSFQKNVQKLVKVYPLIEDIDNTRAEALYRDGHRANVGEYGTVKPNGPFPFKRYFESILHLDKTGQWIFKAVNDNWPDVDRQRGIDTIIERGTPEYIWNAGYNGLHWKHFDFDFDKAMKALFTKKQDNGWYIYLAGTDWMKFDFKRGLDALITQDKIGEAILKAGLKWKRFDYEKGLAALKTTKDRAYYIEARDTWPKGTAEVIQQSQEMKRTAKKMPKVPFKLKEDTKNPYEKRTAEQIYYHEPYDYDFDYRKGLSELIKKDHRGRYIYLAGRDWKRFDFEKGLDGLIKKDYDGEWIYHAGFGWKTFDYEKGLECLKKLGKYVRDAIDNWPKGTKETIIATNEIKRTAKKMSKKPFGLKEDEESDYMEVMRAWMHPRFKKGDKPWFEYHCFESESSSDALLWHHTHQQCTVLRMESGKGMDPEGGRAYKVQFTDGFKSTAMDDELYPKKPKKWSRPDYHK